MKHTRYTTKARQEFKRKQKRDILYIILCTMIVVGIGFKFHHQHIQVASPVMQVHAQTTQYTDAWSKFTDAAEELAPIYNFPLKLLLAQAALESAHGTSYFATTRYNYFGMGAFDYDPNQAYTYENAKQGIIDYMYNIKNTFPDAWASRDNPQQMLQLLENNNQGLMYATDPDYVTKVMSEPEWSNN